MDWKKTSRTTLQVREPKYGAPLLNRVEPGLEDFPMMILEEPGSG